MTTITYTCFHGTFEWRLRGALTRATDRCIGWPAQDHYIAVSPRRAREMQRDVCRAADCMCDASPAQPLDEPGTQADALAVYCDAAGNSAGCYGRR